MTTKPPTNPGNYHWRAYEGDTWEIVQAVLYMGAIHIIPISWDNHSLVKPDGLDGQWQRIPNPDEMQEAWAVKCPAGQYAHVGTEDECINERDRLNDTDMFLAGQEYTCKPVYIVRREIEKGTQ
jgi:hypothetical protein